MPVAQLEVDLLGLTGCPLSMCVCSVANVEGKVNVPARRRLATVNQLQASTGLGGASHPPEETTLHIPRRMTATVTPAQLAGLTAVGFWEQLFAVLPATLHANMTAMLQLTSLPLSDYLLRNNVTQADMDAAVSRLQIEGTGLTLTSPRAGPSLVATTVIPTVDVEFSFTLLDQANQVGANTRITPWATRVLGSGVVFQSVKVAPFYSAFRDVADQSVTPVGQVISSFHNATLAHQLGSAKAANQLRQSLPFPTLLTVSVDIFIRAQVCINGGDIALVL
jgi:hypothetical protein